MKIDRTVSLESISKKVLEQLNAIGTDGTQVTKLENIAGTEINPATEDTLTAGTQKTQVVDPSYRPTILDIPDNMDTTDGSIIYKGYKRGTSYLVCKQVFSGASITTTWGTGAWADRVTITYA